MPPFIKPAARPASGAISGLASGRMSGLTWGMLLALSVLWGGSFFFVGVAVGHVPALTLVSLRVGLAAAALWLVLPIVGIGMPRGSAVWRQLAVMGLLNNAIPFTLFVVAQSTIGSGLAAVLNATTPIFGVVAAHLATRDERMTPSRMAGVLLGVLGVAVMVGPSALDGIVRDLGAQLACLGAALSYACAGVYGRRFRRIGLAPAATAAGQLTASTLMILPLALLVDRPWTLPVPGPAVFAAILGLALASTALAYVLYFRILARAGATNLLLVTFLIPVSAIVLGVAALDEVLLPRQVAGMLLIGCGLAAIDGRLPGLLKAAFPRS